MFSFRDKLLASHLLVVVLVVAGMILGLSRALSSDLELELDARLEQQARGTTAWLAEAGMRHPDKIAQRIASIVHADAALIDREGKVIADTSHQPFTGDETEVTDARDHEIGKATRRGASGALVHYVAVRAADGHILRLAAPLSGIDATVSGMRDRLVVASLFAVVLAVVLGMLFARISVRPLAHMTETAEKLARGEFDVDTHETKDEFGVLARTLKHLATELKARIGDLTSERDRLSAMLRGMVEGVIVFDAKGTVILSNPAAGRMIGMKKLVGRSLEDAITFKDVRDFVQRCLSREIGQTEFEAHVMGKNLVIYVSPLGDEEHEGGVVAVMRDLTEMRLLMTVRRDFVANVSHELRTPIAAIQGYAETLLQAKPDAATQKQFLEIIHRQSNRMGALVEQLLALSEIEARAPGETELALVDVGRVAGEAIESVRGRADKRDVKLTLTSNGETFAMADAEGLERVLINLVDNAVKYGKPGGEVKIDAKTSGERVRIIVKDEGDGIDEVHLPRLFERFYRVDPGRSREQGGSGLGLSIVKHLVEAMGGTIKVESAKGEGTTFTVDLSAGTRV
jgi:two-component system phosphate regulon sensor histidine kinase PhoR